MKLISARIENFRIHVGEQPVRVEFDDQLHVICGPNESGKSTLMDAVAACLFEKCNLSGKAYDAMLPDDGSKPAIEVEFENDGTNYTVRKHFKGQSGTCELTVSRDGRVEQQCSGDEAESRLNEVLRLPATGRGNRKEAQLAHWRLLWIGQGCSTDEPAAQINPETQNDLHGILTAETGGALITPEEAAWMAQLDQQVAECFTAGGKPKAGSRVAQLTGEIEEVERMLAEARARAAAVERDSDRYLECGQKLKQIDQQLPGLRQQLEARTEQHKSVEQLNGLVKETNAALQLKGKEASALRQQADRLEQLRAAVAKRHPQIDTVARQIGVLDEQLEAARQTRLTREKQRDEADEKFRQARRAAMRADAHVSVLRAARDAEVLEERINKAQHHTGEINRIKNALAVIPVDHDDVEQLQELQTGLGQLQGALDVASANIRVTSKHSIQIRQNDETEQHEPDDPVERQIDRETRITIGDQEATVCISPGGEDLEQRRERVVEARQELHDRLMELGIASVAEARQQLRDRQRLENELHTAQTRLEDIAGRGVESLHQELETANQTLRKARAELERYTDPDDPELPADSEEAAVALQAHRTQHHEAEQARDAAREALQQLDRQIDQIRSDRQLKAQQHQQLEAQNQDDQEQIDNLIDLHGDAKVLAQQIEQLSQEIDGLEKQRRKAADELAELQPDLIDQELERLDRAIEMAESEKRAIENEQNQLLGQLSASDAIGLNEQIGDLDGRLKALREQLEREQRRADAMKLLLDTVRSCRDQMTQQIMLPLRQKVEPLLRVLFGDAELDFGIEDGSTALTLRPLVRSHGVDPFDRLSVGTREQVGVAVRLALAQVLSEQHGGKLPVVLDEPFVNTDPARLSRALAILNMVSKHLQVVVMTCCFGDYRELGLGPGQITELTARSAGS